MLSRIVKVVKKEDKLAKSLLSPQVNLTEAMEIISLSGVVYNALGKSVTIIVTLYLMSFTWQVCVAISLLNLAWDLAPVLAKKHRQAAAIAKILTLLVTGKILGPSTEEIIWADLKEAMADGKITKEELIEIAKDILKQKRHIVVDRQ